MRKFLTLLLILTTPEAVCANPYSVRTNPYETRANPYTSVWAGTVSLPKKEYAQPVEKLELLYLTTPGCWTCTLGERLMDSDWLPKASWKGKIRRLHDVNEVDRYGATRYPTWILVRGGKEIGRINPPAQVDVRQFVTEGLNLYNRNARATPREDAGAAPTPIAEVERVLNLLPRPEVGYVDFGCGDGRWLIAAARKWPGVRITGVEIDPARAAATRERVRNEGLSGQVTVITGDATAVEVGADVGTMYLYADVLQRMKPRLERLKAFASYMHAPSGFNLTKSGDTFFYRKPEPAPFQRGAVWEGQVYSAPVCNNPNCQMCNSIRYQLSY